MADCEVCEDKTLLLNAACDEKSFRVRVLETLCYIYAYLTDESEEPAEETVVLPQVQIEAADIEADYASYSSITDFLDTTKKLKKLRIVNVSDCDLDFSFDAGDTTHITVLAGTEYKGDFDLVLDTTGSFEMQKASGQTAGNGRVIIEGSY